MNSIITDYFLIDLIWINTYFSLKYRSPMTHFPRGQTREQKCLHFFSQTSNLYILPGFGIVFRTSNYR